MLSRLCVVPRWEGAVPSHPYCLEGGRVPCPSAFALLVERRAPCPRVLTPSLRAITNSTNGDRTPISRDGFRGFSPLNSDNSYVSETGILSPCIPVSPLSLASFQKPANPRLCPPLLPNVSHVPLSLLSRSQSIDIIKGDRTTIDEWRW